MSDSKGTLAAKKAWETIRKREADMSADDLKALHRRRSRAAKKAWKTIRRNQHEG